MLVTDSECTSFISGADLALALVDEIEKPAHRRERFTVAYCSLVRSRTCQPGRCRTGETSGSPVPGPGPEHAP